MMRILIADDHVVVRSGLKRMFEAEFPGVALGEVSNCKDLLDKVKSARWDVVILDVAMGAENGLNALPKLKAACPTLPVIVLSMYGERQFITRALAEGASAYLTKEQAADEEIFRAIRTVCAGRRYLGEALAEQLADHLAQDRKGKLHEILSSRELEVFLLLAAAKSVSEIAEQLGLSEGTVKIHATAVFKALGVGSRTQALVAVARYGIDFESVF